MEFSFTPLNLAQASNPRAIVQPRLVTMTTWRDALNGTAVVQVVPPPRSQSDVALQEMPRLITAPPKPQTGPAMSRWERARSIFTVDDKVRYIHLDQHAWEEEFKVTSEWNTKPSRIETFLAQYDKHQALTTVAVVVLLLLWIY